ncbi:MAG: TIM barrel protein [Chlorobiaceae bacterium]|jgi:hypothetical protein|nr:TIM barrel protein [Chlorobiaceae bacterium]
MEFLLNISTHPGDLDIAGENWSEARALLRRTGFDGFELYPVGSCDYRAIPSDLIRGIHLRFFVMLRQIWNNDRKGLLEMFGTEENVRLYYGGTDRDAVLSVYRRQFELATHFRVPYVVFHPVHYELEYVFSWNPPWGWRETVDLSAEIINEVVQDTGYTGWILFENLWWPGNFRLDCVEEIDRLLSRVTYGRCGIVLDTGHILNRNQELRTEREAIAYLLDEVEKLGEYCRLIKAAHLCKSVSGEAVKAGMQLENPYAEASDFWQRFAVALSHVKEIDRHEPFSDAAIGGLFDLIDPERVVFELAYRSLEEWTASIECQQRALIRFFRNDPEGDAG